jgi:hypothetical protein
MRVCIVGSSKRFFSGITAHTIFLANALAKRNQVSVLLLRNLLPRFLFPGRGHVGKDQYHIDFAPEVEVYDGMDYNSPLSWLRAYRFLKKQRPEAIIIGSGILISEIITFLYNTNSALLLAMNTDSVIPDSVQNTANKTKAMMNIALCLMKLKAGDQISRPATKTAAPTKAAIPLRVKQEFIISTGLSALGRKRTRALLKPSLPNKAKKVIADIMAAPKPTSASV